MALFREELDPEVEPLSVSKILIREQYVLEGELIPVIQSIVNKEIRDMQSNGNKYFSPITIAQGSDLKIATTTLVSKINFDSGAQDDVELIGMNDNEGEEHICLAALSCLKTVRPLLNYWMHLPQHREYLVTIIERLQLGFVSSSRQELETIDWRMLSTEKKYRVAILEAIRNDPLFDHYRNIVHEGRSAADDLMTQRPRQEANKAFSLSATTSILAKAHGAGSAASSEIECWGSLWNVSSSSYAVTNENICHDFPKIQIIAAIAYGCDWLANKLSKRYLNTARKALSSSSMATQNAWSNPAAGVAYGSRPAKTTSSSNRQDIVVPLRQAFQGGVKELSRLSEESIAILRGELQLACFHYLHLVSKLDLSSSIAATTKASGGIRDTDGRPEPEALIGAWNQYILSFQDAILQAAHPSLLSVVFSPLCYLAPKLLMRCIRDLFDSSIRSSFDGQDGKTKLLRAVVACQQGLSMLLESSRLDPIVNRELQDLLTDEFSRIRRFVQLVGCFTSDLRLFIAHNGPEYSKEEYKTLWSQTKDRAAHEVLQDFEFFWNIATKGLQGNKTEAPAQQGKNGPSVSPTTAQRGPSPAQNSELGPS